MMDTSVMHGYTVYDDDTGKIITSGWVTALEDVAAQSNAMGEPMRHIVMDGYYSATEFYVVEHEAIPRPKITPIGEREIIADGQHITSISNIPEGTKLIVLVSTPASKPTPYGEELTIDDGEFEFVTSVPATYRLQFTPPFPHQNQTVTVMANAP